MNTRRGRVLTADEVEQMLEEAGNWTRSAVTDEPATTVVAMTKLMELAIKLGFSADLGHTLAPIETEFERVYAEMVRLTGGILSPDNSDNLPEVKDHDPYINNAVAFLVEPFFPFQKLYEAPTFYQTQFERKVGEASLGIEVAGTLVAVIAFETASRISDTELYFQGQCVFVRSDVQYAWYNRQGKLIPSVHKHLQINKSYGIIVQTGDVGKALIYPVREK